jgi:hypothetical protein
MINPWVILGFVLALAGVYGYGHHAGYQERELEMQAEISRLNEQARASEQVMNNKLNDKVSELRKAKDAISKKQSDINALADAGKLQLPTSSCIQTSADAGASTGDRDEARAKLERETIKALVAIVADGDKNTTQLNACIDTYNQVKEKINGKR